jgi:hypothetical protein
MTQKETFRFASKASAHTVIVSGNRPIRHPTTGDIIGYTKELVAEFGECEPEQDVFDVNGDPLVDPYTGQQFGKTANIRGHFFDSRQQQEAKGWTDDEHDRVVAQVQRAAAQHPGLLWELKEQKVPAPWPNYDTTDRAKIVDIAQTLGFVGEALAYEKQNRNRSTITGPLEQIILREQQQAADDSALTAA